ncbi:MAG TPA: V-type ATPase subunit [Myxococcales bacterium]|nr:V-type ATPase subunit [Myxococcales bacterium]
MSTAYAYARTRARRSTLLRPEQLDAFRAASGRAAAVAALRSSGIDARDAAAASRACLLRFVADAERLVASWPHPDLLVAVVGLIEIENLKLGCRAVRTGAAAESWTPLWRPLGKVSRLRIEAFADPPSLRAALEALAPLPWGAAASRALRAHEDDAAAFEIALDTFASRRLLEAEAAAGARRLAASLVRIRDVDAVSRAAARGRTAEGAATAAALLRKELHPEALRALAGGELTDAARAFFRSPARTVAALLEELRARLRSDCLRTFAGSPFQPACAVALLLLRIEEMQAVTSIAESQLDREAA